MHLAPRGAGYRAWAETFLKGRPLNVTDLAVGPTARCGSSPAAARRNRLCIESPTSAMPTCASPSPHEEACQKHATAACARCDRSWRTRHRTLGETAVAFAWPHLDSPDPLIRHATRIAIEHQPLDTWRKRALTADRPASLTALLALARSGDKDSIPRIIDRVIGIDSKSLPINDALTLIQIYFLCLEQAPESVRDRRQAILAQLEPMFPHPGLHISPVANSASLNRDVARLLAQLGSTSIIEKLTGSLLTGSRQEDRLLGLFALRNVQSGWSNENRRTYFSALNEAESFVAGEGMPKFLSQIREQAIADLSDAERLSLADLLAPPDSREPEPLPPARPLVKQWTLADFSASLQDSPSLGDPTRGEVIFRDALCGRCHRAGAARSGCRPRPDARRRAVQPARHPRLNPVPV